MTGIVYVDGSFHATTSSGTDVTNQFGTIGKDKVGNSDGTGFKVTENFDLRLGINNLTDVRLQEKDTVFQNVEPGRSYYVSGSARF